MCPISGNMLPDIFTGLGRLFMAGMELQWGSVKKTRVDFLNLVHVGRNWVHVGHNC